MRALTFKEFLQRCAKVHGDRYDYSLAGRKEASGHIKVICRVHGEFRTHFYNHLRGHGCSRCRASKPRTSKYDRDWWIDEANRVHDGFYHYGAVPEGVKNSTMVTVTCPLHGDFQQRASSHIQGRGCQRCGWKCNSRYSGISIRWLEYESKRRRLKIVHAGNVGEFQLPGTRIRVDGFNERTQTVFEFHGDAFHGNPNVHSPRSKPHPYRDVTAARLYRDTCERDAYIRSLGYNLIVMWEQDFRAIEAKLSTKEK